MTVGGSFGYLIFDLDGTLSDPLPGMAMSINHALTSCAYPAQELSTLAQYVGPPLEGTFQALVEGLDASTQASLIGHYRERYKTQGYTLNSVYPGIQTLLESLRNDRRPLGVCTSKPEPIARQVLRHFSLESYFDFVSGGDIGVTKAQQLKSLLAEGTIDHSSLMIGDRHVDMLAASSNELRCCGVTWGYGSQQELAEAGADHIVSGPEELLAYLSVHESVPVV